MAPYRGSYPNYSQDMRNRMAKDDPSTTSLSLCKHTLYGCPAWGEISNHNPQIPFRSSTRLEEEEVQCSYLIVVFFPSSSSVPLLALLPSSLHHFYNFAPPPPPPPPPADDVSFPFHSTRLKGRKKYRHAHVLQVFHKIRAGGSSMLISARGFLSILLLTPHLTLLQSCPLQMM